MQQQRQRAGARRKCYLSGRLIFNGASSSLDAVVRNISSNGALLSASGLSIVPTEFDLLIHGGDMPDTRCRARRVWSGGDRMGISFSALPSDEPASARAH